MITPKRNPFNPVTQIRFGLPEAATVSMIVYDLSGRRVKALLSGTPFSPGWHRVTWNGKDELDRPQSTGVYFYRLKADRHVLTHKMLLLK